MDIQEEDTYFKSKKTNKNTLRRLALSSRRRVQLQEYGNWQDVNVVSCKTMMGLFPVCVE